MLSFLLPDCFLNGYYVQPIWHVYWLWLRFHLIAVKIAEAKARYEARLTRRHSDIEDLVSSLGVEELRTLVVRLAIRSPSLVFDIMDATEIANNGDTDNERHHPPEDVSAWCRCSKCRHMPSAAVQLCCRMQPRHCLRRSAGLEILVLDEGVLAVADQHRADMLASEVHLDNKGCCGGMDARNDGDVASPVATQTGEIPSTGEEAWRINVTCDLLHQHVLHVETVDSFSQNRTVCQSLRVLADCLTEIRHGLIHVRENCPLDYSRQLL